MSELPKNLIDLGKYPSNEVDLIAREYLRCVYLETLDIYIKDYAKLGEEDQSRKNVIETLQSFERLISVLDGNEDFLQAVHADNGEVEEAVVVEDEFERF